MSETLSQEDETFDQEVTGTFLYYAQAVDATMLPALGSILSQQANPLSAKCKRHSNYLTTPPHTLMQLLITVLGTWFYLDTAMHHNFLYPAPKAKQEETLHEG